MVGGVRYSGTGQSRAHFRFPCISGQACRQAQQLPWKPVSMITFNFLLLRLPWNRIFTKITPVCTLLNAFPNAGTTIHGAHPRSLSVVPLPLRLSLAQIFSIQGPFDDSLDLPEPYGRATVDCWLVVSLSLPDLKILIFLFNPLNSTSYSITLLVLNCSLLLAGCNQV